MKNKMLCIFVTMLFVIVMSGCSNTESTTNIDADANTKVVDSETVEAEENLEIFIKADMEENGGKPSFVLTTNLPDETTLMITIHGENGYSAQDKVSVANGKATTANFSNQGRSLFGKYTLEVSTPFAMVMSNSVQSVIGKHGENLKGDLVETSSGESRIVTTFDFEIK